MTYSYKHLCSILLCLTFAISTFGETIYVKANATGSNNGNNWGNAYTDLNQALADADSGDQIWVAAGSYYPTTSTDRNISFDIPDGVQVLGGFPNSGNPTMANRNPQTNISTLSGDIGQTGNSSDNSYTIIYTKDVSASTIVDGFTISGGNANSSAIPEFPVERTNGGAAWFNESSSFVNSNPTIINCNFINNNASNRGGALFSQAGSGAHTNYSLEDCLFQNNFAENDGGAIFNTHSGSGSECSPIVSNTNFQSNTAGFSGGAIFNDASYFGDVSGTYTNCDFISNTADNEEGGAINNNAFFQGTTSPTYIQCRFVLNNAEPGSGGAIYTDASANGVANYKITSCTFDRNISNVYGGAICNIISNNGTIKPIYTNCIFKENESTNGGASYSRGSFGSNLDVVIANCVFYKNNANIGGTVYQNETGTTSYVTTKISNSIFQENTAGFSPTFHLTGTATIGINHSLFDVNNCLDLVHGGGTNEADCGAGNIYNQDPQFANPAGGNYHVLASSPAIDSGNNSDVPAGVGVDFDGNPRVAGGLVDMGIFEQVNNTSDVDGDGILDINDNCPLIANANQADADGDGAGAVCDCDDSVTTGPSCSTGCTTFYLDADGDTYGNPAVSITTCIAPNGYVTNNQDFNDSDNTLYPNAPELCDGKDNDNNGQIDENTDDDNDGVCNEDDICPGGDDNVDLNNNGIPDDCESVINITCPADITLSAPVGQNSVIANWSVPSATTDCNGGGGSGGSCNGNAIAGFTYIGEHDGHDYYMAQNAASWTAAQSLCDANGGYLSVINNAAENDFLKNNSNNNIIHIGLTDFMSEGTYEWVNGDAFSYNNLIGSPNSEDYGILYFWDGSWDMSGDYTKFYILEKPCGGGGGSGLAVNQTAGPANGAAFPIGSTSVTYTATDNCGGNISCTFNVTVQASNSTLSITCPANITVNAPSGATNAVVTWVAPTHSTNCTTGTVTKTPSHASGSSFPIGVTTVNYTATDGCGGTANCSFTVTVNPVGSDIQLNCPADITETVSTPTSTVPVTWANPTGSSNCASGGFAFSQTSGPTTGSQFGVGSTTIIYTATDGCGGSTTCSFTVTVNVDNSSLNISCPSNISISVPQGAGGGAANWATPTATTDCVIGGGGGNACSGANKAGYTYLGEYNSSDYYISDGTSPWLTARANAVIAGGTLAGIEDAAENNYIKSVIGSEIVHIGLNDETTEGNLEWLNGESTSYTNFSGFNPNNAANDFTVFYFWDGSWDFINNDIWKKSLLEIKCNGGTNSVPVITQTAGPTSGSNFPVGTTTVTYQATDDCNNLTTCSFTVTVTESTNTCNPDTDGGAISGNEIICDPYDPTTITSTSLPSGGSGGITYVWLQSTSGCPNNINQQIANSNNPTYNPPFISTTTHYVRWSKRADCTNWVASNCITKTVDDCGGGGSYCTLGAEQPWQEWVSKVELADLNNPSSKSLGYEDYTNLVANITAGQQYTVSVELTFSYNQWDQNVYVWMDFNQDNDFSDAGELILDLSSPSNGDGGAQPAPITQSFTVPSNAVAGSTRMRVSMRRTGSNTNGSNPCGTYSHGETEDYTLNITASSSLRSARTLAFEVYPVNGKSVLEWFSNTTDLEAYYEVEHSTNNQDFETIEDVTVFYGDDFESFYKIVDENPALGENYYRIKQIFHDGQEKYTDVRKLVYGQKAKGFNYYPNPASEFLYLDLKSYAGQKGSIKIINMLGQVMESIQLEELPVDAIRISLDRLENGMHSLVFSVDGKPVRSELLVVEKMR